MRVFGVSIEDSVLVIDEFEGEKFKAFRKEHKLKTQKQAIDFLSDNDYHVFKTEKEASNFIKLYEETKGELKKLKDHSHTGLMRSMLLKRRYLVTTAMGIKKSTFRHYKKNWNVGDTMRFYDQSFFILVTLKEIKEVEIDSTSYFEYKFKLC